MERPLVSTEIKADPAESLIEAARRGSSESLGRLFEQARGALLRAADHELPTALRAKESAGDLVQETFLVAHRRFHSFEGRTTTELTLWLKAILRNTSAHLRRSYRTARRGTHREVSIDALDSFSAEPSASDSTPSVRCQRREAAAMLENATARLSLRDRQVLQMRHHDQLTFEEIGRRLGVSTVAARNAWLKAVGRLRDQLDPV